MTKYRTIYLKYLIVINFAVGKIYDHVLFIYILFYVFSLARKPQPHNMKVIIQLEEKSLLVKQKNFRTIKFTAKAKNIYMYIYAFLNFMDNDYFFWFSYLHSKSQKKIMLFSTFINNYYPFCNISDNKIMKHILLLIKIF